MFKAFRIYDFIKDNESSDFYGVFVDRLYPLSESGKEYRSPPGIPNDSKNFLVSFMLLSSLYFLFRLSYGFI